MRLFSLLPRWLILLFLATTVWADSGVTVVTLTSPQMGGDPRLRYHGLVLRLVLEKTRAEYGDFRITLSPVMNTARAIEEMAHNRIRNQVLLTTFQNDLLDQGIDYARFPSDFGVTGYRVCFVSPKARDAVSRVTNIDELKRFSIGQGMGWADSQILKANGFQVLEIGKHANLYPMLVANRFDLFCRGINELEREFKDHQDETGLDYDRHFAISYPLPRFFFAHRSNRALLDRIERGLQIAYQDGSLKALWLEQYGSALRFANLRQRRIFELTTPSIDRIDFDYRKYYFDPREYLPQ